jgi:hypothetical protein
MSTVQIGYPTGWTLAVVDHADEAAEAIRDLIGAGIGDDDIAHLSRSDDVATLERLGASRGLAAHVRRATQYLTMDQSPDLAVYERAVAEGHSVVGVRVDELERRRDAIAILRRHGAHFVNRFGAWATEEIAPWRGRMPAMPQHLTR